MRKHIVLAGDGKTEHIGSHFRKAAENLGWPVSFHGVEAAYSSSPVVRKLNWWLRGHRPARLGWFSQEVALKCRDLDSAVFLSTGIAPVSAEALARMGRQGVIRLNYLTDDPWNVAHRAPWFMEALKQYDWVFSPRTANISDLKAHDCRNVHYLPFGYANDLHFPEVQGPGDDVVFAGGADADRIMWIRALLNSGVSVRLYGGYWRRYPETRPIASGFANPEQLRKAVACSSVALCLVRRANRDGHAMRTFELAAMKACMLVEKTQEHTALFGEEARAVLYFQTVAEMVDKVKWLLERPSERERLREAVYRLITGGANTYRDRLATMLGVAGCGGDAS